MLNKLNETLDRCKIYTDFVGLYNNNSYKNFVSFYPKKDYHELDEDYEKRLIKIALASSYCIDGEKKKKIKKEQIVRKYKTRMPKANWKHLILENNSESRNDFYDSLTTMSRCSSEYCENQLLGCIYEMENILSQTHGKDISFLLLCADKTKIRLYLISDDMEIIDGKINWAKTIDLINEELVSFIADIEEG